jgi:drug/metabolite transporter (DMT)-like permease
MTVLLALLASLFIGVSDFLGGTASRTRSPLETSVVVFLTTLVTLVPITVLLGASDLTVHDLGLGAISGLPTSIAYVGFFTAIGRGRMSIVVPISAAVTALMPAITGIAEGNVLSTVALAGILCALVAIPLVAYETGDGVLTSGGDDWPAVRQVLVAILCGVGFGIYFVCVGHTHRSSGLWPTVASLVVAIAVLVPLAARGGAMPTVTSLPRLAIAGGVALGLADVALTTALQRGPLTIASVLGNLYPLVTIALGVTILKERLRPWHVAGILLALAGVVMIASGQ